VSSGDGYLLPGMFGTLYDDPGEATLHQAGFDSLEVSTDDLDRFGNDVVLASDGPEQWSRENLPQFGPAFVRYVHDEFSKVHGAINKSIAKWSYEPTTAVIFGSMNADANGNVNRAVSDKAMLYEPPPGFTLALHRLVISVGGFNFGTPFSAAGAYWELRVNDEMMDGGSLVAGSGSLPVAYSRGTRDAVRCRDGEVLSLNIVGTAALAGKSVTVRGQGTLERNESA
jgi:hypothetical protein